MSWIQENSWSLITGLLALWALHISKKSQRISEEAVHVSKKSLRDSQDNALEARYSKLVIRKFQHMDYINNDKPLIISLEIKLKKLLAWQRKLNERLDKILNTEVGIADGKAAENFEAKRVQLYTRLNNKERLKDQFSRLEIERKRKHAKASDMKLLPRYDAESLRLVNITVLENDLDEIELINKHIHDSVITLEHQINAGLTDIGEFNQEIEECEELLEMLVLEAGEKQAAKNASNMMCRRR
jgi:hypothetical protein